MWLFNPQPACRVQWPQRRPGFCHAPEGGRVERGGALLGLRRHQPHFLPLAGTFPAPGPWLHRADHGSVRLGNHLLSSHCGQHPKGLLIFLTQLLTRPAGMVQRGAAHRAGPNRKPIMLLDTLCCPGKGVLAAKVRR